MNSRERMCKVLNHQVPDRIPTFEYAIDKKTVEAIYPGGTYADVVEKLDLDAITAWEPSMGGYVPGMADRLKPGDTFLDEWGVRRKATGEMSAYPLEDDPVIREESDLKRLNPPDPDSGNRFEILRQYIKRFRGDKIVSYAIIDMFEISKCLMGMEEFLIAFKQRPNLIRALFELTTDWVIEVAEKAIDIGADMIIDNADVAYKMSSWTEPRLMRELFVPCLRRVADAVKKRRAYIFYHSHGNIWELLDALVGTGIDVLHPLAYEDGMDIGIVKRVYGERIAVAGNISTDFLSRGSRDEVIRLVKETISRTSAGGGYILMASSSIYSGVNPENYRTMVETAQSHKYR